MRICGTRKTPTGKVTTEKNAARAWRRLYLPITQALQPDFYCESYGRPEEHHNRVDGLRFVADKDHGGLVFNSHLSACLMSVGFAKALNKALRAKAKQGDPNTVTIKRSTLERLEKALEQGIRYNHAALSLTDMLTAGQKRTKRLMSTVTRLITDRQSMEATQRLLQREVLNQLPADPVMLDDNEDDL